MDQFDVRIGSRVYTVIDYRHRYILLNPQKCDVCIGKKGRKEGNDQTQIEKTFWEMPPTSTKTTS